MINSSLDILYLTLSICSLFVAVFLCWLLFYLIKTLKKTHDVINFISKITTSVNDFVSDMKQKAKSSATYFKLFNVITDKLIQYIDKGFFKKKSSKKQNTKTKTRKQK
ncbi:MAG TPA: hypothetical protein PLD95_00200 [bacterium]|jgi:uncharacterized protein YoxC|nr:hypothetical protein [bacterium]HOG37878.1 hypothetical protein [bacterium]HQI03094.1 hypothetical protein [bacterium]